MLEEMGLSAAIRWHLDGFASRSGIQVTSEVADVRLRPDAELALFRVLQESLTNVHRHSKSKTAHIRLASTNGHAVLEIKDEGQGIPPGSAVTDDFALGTLGVGIRGMRERVRQLGGTLNVSSSDSGTVVSATIPVEGK
jgi:two-component system, NarL family, sensor kinase